MNEQEKQIALKEEEKRIEGNISKINHRIAVFSGKGGVGKTTVSVNLAFCFQMEGFSTGILDADITGPNVAKVLGINDDSLNPVNRLYGGDPCGQKLLISFLQM